MVKARLRNNAQSEISAAVKGLVDNVISSRRALLDKALDPRRDINVEAGYPDEITPQQYKELYKREGISTRIVEIEPEESWKTYPEIIENEEGDETEFETAVNDLEMNTHFFHYLNKVDELSGIGRFGILLLGIDDGLGLEMPVDGIDEQGKKVGKAENKIIYLRAFDESSICVNELETNTANPRFGKPVSYNVDFVLERGVGQTAFKNTFKVHWHRVIHITDNAKESEVFGMPRMQKVFNRMLDLRKLLAGSSEMFWKGAFPGYSFEVDPNLQGTVQIDKEALKKEIEMYTNGLQRYLANEGLTVKSLAPQVADPSNHFKTLMQAVAISIGVPLRILMGSEQAQLASAQDSRAWNGRMSKRQDDYLSPMVVRPFIDRMIAIGALPEIEMYLVVWPDLDALTTEEISTIGKNRTEAIAKYVQSGASNLVPPFEFFTIILGLTDEEADAIIKAAGTMLDLINEPAVEKEIEKEITE